MKNAVQNGQEFSQLVERIKPGLDVTVTCLDECLYLAVEGNFHFAAGSIILREPNNIQLFQESFKKTSIKSEKETAAMLLICIAAIRGDCEILKLFFDADTIAQQSKHSKEEIILKREYFPGKELTVGKFEEYRFVKYHSVLDSKTSKEKWLKTVKLSN